MRLSDHFLAAVGSISDIGGFAASMQRAIREAQRFEVADEVAMAAGKLIHTRPSTLVAALPLCRMPYDVMWLEYRGGLAQQGARAFDGAPVPWKQGVLIEAMPGGQTGFMTVCWMHAIDQDADWLHPVNISPISVWFDWREDGNVRDVVQRGHRVLLDSMRSDPGHREVVEAYCEHMERKWISNEWTSSDQRIRAVMSGLTGWKGFADNPKEHEAMRQLDRHMLPGISPHGMGMISTLLPRVNDKEMTKLIMKWEADMQGEGGWVQCLLVMLNSRNPVVEHTPVDLAKLNKARRKSGKAEFLPYAKTRLTMSRSQKNIAHARGVDRETARQHLVMGHFKVRKTGVYWWAPFLRGDPTKGEVPRREYDVVK